MTKDEIREFFEDHQPSDESDDDDAVPTGQAPVDPWLAGAADRLADRLTSDDRAAILALVKR